MKHALIILALSVSGNPATSDKLPGLIVTYPYSQNGPQSWTVEGPGYQGSDVVNGFTASQSLECSTNGEGAISVGVSGGIYLSTWQFSAEVSVYKL